MGTVDLSLYRSFCFRGEGRCNMVISAKEKATNTRIVWRLAKHRKSGMISSKPKCEVVNKYLENIVSHFLRTTFLIRPKMVLIASDKLYSLAKIPSLPHNLKIETWEELEADSSAFSFFSYAIEKNGFSQSKNAKTYNLHGMSLPGYVCALEMPDATRIPRQLQYASGPTITVEIKPKQGFAQVHPNMEDILFCNNCILQIEKWRSQAFNAMYDFCPLDIYSGDHSHMCSAIESLVRDPHRNLRIFVNGNVIHEENRVLPRDELGAACFPQISGEEFDHVGLLVSAVACILAGVRDETDLDFRLKDDSILSDLLKAQRIDTIGIVRAFEFYRSLPATIQRELMDNSNLLRHNNFSFLSKTDARSLVERYLLAATMKDCSLMVSLIMVDHNAAISLFNNVNQHIVRLRTSGGLLYFAYSIRIVDLDPKSAKNLENAYRRFIAGIKTIRANPEIHRHCRI